MKLFIIALVASAAISTVSSEPAGTSPPTSVELSKPDAKELRQATCEADSAKDLDGKNDRKKKALARKIARAARIAARKAKKAARLAAKEARKAKKSEGNTDEESDSDAEVEVQGPLELNSEVPDEMDNDADDEASDSEDANNDEEQQPEPVSLQDNPEEEKTEATNNVSDNPSADQPESDSEEQPNNGEEAKEINSVPETDTDQPNSPAQVEEQQQEESNDEDGKEAKEQQVASETEDSGAESQEQRQAPDEVADTNDESTGKALEAEVEDQPDVKATEEFSDEVPVARCGAEFGGATCSDGKCCSSHGWCGISDAHCGDGCQSGCDWKPQELQEEHQDAEQPAAVEDDQEDDGDAEEEDAQDQTTEEASNDDEDEESDDEDNEEETADEENGEDQTTEETATAAEQNDETATATASEKQPRPLKTPTPFVAPMCIVRDDGRCGPEFGNASCRPGNCCSNHGWCGSTPEHCGDGKCQYQCDQAPKAHCSAKRDRKGRQLACKKPGDIAFFFQNGPNMEFSQSIADTFSRHHLKANFFWLGNKLRNKRRAAKAKEIIAQGHEIGTRGMNAGKLHHRSYCAISKQLQRSKNVTFKNLGVVPQFYTYQRLGFSRRMRFAVADNDLHNIRGNLRWFGKAWNSMKKIKNRAPRILSRADPSTDSFIIGMNENRPTARAVDHLISLVQERGFNIVSMSECLGHNAYGQAPEDSTQTVGDDQVPQETQEVVGQEIPAAN